MQQDTILIPQMNDTRILYLSGDVENTNISEVCSSILSINDTDRKGMEKFKSYDLVPIQLHVQSYGGTIDDMWALIDIIEASITPVITYCSGYCMSAAALIFLAGHHRVMYPHSSIMFHQMLAGTFGKFEDLKLEQRQFDTMHKGIIKYIKSHTKLKKKFFHKMVDLKQDMYLTAKQCLKHGVCDKIINNTDTRDCFREQLAQLVNQEIELEDFENE